MEDRAESFWANITANIINIPNIPGGILGGSQFQELSQAHHLGTSDSSAVFKVNTACELGWCSVE